MSLHNDLPDLSQLVDPACFQPIVDQEIPIEFRLDPSLLAQYTSDELLEKKHYIAAARKSADLLVQIDDKTDYETIFRLWGIRMKSLIFARLGRIVRVEAKVLGDASGEKYRLQDGTSIVPWELRLFLVPVWAGGDTQNGLTRYYALAREARIEGERAKSIEADGNGIYKSKLTWDNRLRELGLYIASTLVGMRDSITAIDHLKSLYYTAQKVGGEENIKFGHKVTVSLAFIYLMIGDTLSAREWFQLSPEEYSKELALAACSLADGDTTESVNLLEKYLEEGVGKSEEKADKINSKKTEALNNLAVSYLHDGNLTKAIELLEKVISTASINPTALFNLFYLYDLQHESPSTKKRNISQVIKSRDIESLGSYELFLHR